MRFDHYARMQEIHDTLTEWAEKWPQLCSLSSIGRTREGRDIDLLILTDTACGAAEDKPAFLVDGNLHSGEVASSMAVMYILQHWLEAYGQDAEITRLLREYAVYAIPRINADAAEVVLTTPRMLRGSTEAYYPEEDGVVPEDMDGDGEIRQIRIQDPAGRWKAWEEDPSILLPRAPEDTQGTFYTLVPEGRLRGGKRTLVELKEARPREDLDPNRQFPFEWNAQYPDPDRPTSGPAPLHDCEVRALADFVEAHPRIVFNMNFHTYGGLHISPAAFCPHLETDASDLTAMRELGQSMHEKTGYKCRGIFPEGAKDIAPGSYTTWEYYEKGIMAFVTELWDFHAQADPERPESWSMFFAESREQFLREAKTAVEWDRAFNGGRGFRAWEKCTLPGWPESLHMELGGWADRFVRNNPPPQYLEGVCRRAFETAMVAFRSLPRLEIAWLGTSEGESGAQADFLLANHGYLPLTGTALAEEKGVAGLCYSVSMDGQPEGEPVKIHGVAGYAKQMLSIPLPEKRLAAISLRVWGEKCGEKRITVCLSGKDEES